MLPVRLLTAAMLALSACVHAQPSPATDASRFAALLQTAEAGNAPAQCQVGDAYFDGAGVARDLHQAYAWFRRCAEQGNRDGQYQLGRMYLYGDGVAIDAAQALAWYRKAADQSGLDAINDIGVMYQDGSAGTRDPAAARAWYLRAAQGGSALGQLNLGRMLEGGLGGPVDLPGALARYQQAAANGNIDAANRAGNMLLFGVGGPVSFGDSAHYFKLGAEANNPVALERLGHLYLNGYGVDRDPVAAALLFRQSAALGHGPAKLQLAYCLGEGVGVAKDEAAARALYVEGAADKDPYARKQLVLMLQDGRGGPRDTAGAAALIAAMEADSDANGLARLAASYRERMQFEQAGAMYAAALRAMERTVSASGDAAALRPLLVQYAAFYILTGKYGDARAMADRALAVEAAADGPDAPGLTDPLEILAYLHAARNEYVAAIALLERALVIEKAHRLDISGAATQLGTIAQVQDRDQDAERYYRDARTWLYVDYPIGDRAFSRNDASVASLYTGQGKYAEAEALLVHALQDETSAPRPDPREVAARTSELGLLYLQQGRLEDAATFTQRALDIAEKKVGSVRGLAGILTLLGRIDVRRRHFGEAQALLARALALDEQLTGPDHTNASATLQVQAELALAQGQPDRAAALVGRALAINEGTLGPSNSEVALNLDLLGQVRQAQADAAGAQAALARAWAIRRDANLPLDDKRATATRLAVVYRLLQREDDARPLDAWLADHG